MYKYIDLTVEVYEEYFEISFFESESPSEFNYGHSLQYSRGRGRPKSDGCTCKRRGGNLKFLICALYVSKLSQTNYLQISDSSFVAGLQVIFFFFCFFWIQQYFKKYTKKPVTKIYVTSCAGKTLCRKCFDTVKLHSRVPGGIFRIFVLEMVIRMHP